MVTYKEFEIIKILLNYQGIQENIPSYILKKLNYYIFDSIEEIEILLINLERKGYIKNNQVTSYGLEEIEELRVESAIILAAGGNDISDKSIYSIPKGLFIKDGETLIERQIRHLKEVGIDNITVVIGYKQELYFYLQDKWNVNLEVNPDLKKNNIYSLYMAKKYLGNTYICNCDNYFKENPFSKYEYNSYHATVYKRKVINELFVRKNCFGRILEIYSGETEGECIYGHAYLNKEFSERMVKYMEKEISNFRVSTLFWEEFVSRHIDNFSIYARQYFDNFLFEFDTIQEIQNIQGLFLDNVSEQINRKICEVLKCKRDEISDIVILQKGLTNILFTFIVKNKKYIFRYPGDSSQFFIYRKNECLAQELAASAHVDDTHIYIDETGIKISKFREKCYDLYGLYYKDIELMKMIAKKIRDFHEKGYTLSNYEEYIYNPIKECEKLFIEASKVKGDLFKVFKKEWILMRKLQKYADMDGIQHTMCHNDINIDNILYTGETLDIIDWEFAGFNDPAYDFGRVIAGLEYEVDDPKILEILESYFGRPATEKEYIHWLAYSAIHNWYYVGWALYKESINESSRDWMLFFFKQSKKLAEWCIPKYELMYGKI